MQRVVGMVMERMGLGSGYAMVAVGQRRGNWFPAPTNGKKRKRQKQTAATTNTGNQRSKAVCGPCYGAVVAAMAATQYAVTLAATAWNGTGKAWKLNGCACWSLNAKGTEIQSGREGLLRGKLE